MFTRTLVITGKDYETALLGVRGNVTIKKLEFLRKGADSPPFFFIRYDEILLFFARILCLFMV